MRRRGWLLLLALALLPAACGGGGPAEYTDQTRADVLAACESEELDPGIIGDVCACTYRQIRINIPYERFREIDQQLRLQPHAPLPDDVLELLAGCVIQVGDL